MAAGWAAVHAMMSPVWRVVCIGALIALGLDPTGAQAMHPSTPAILAAASSPEPTDELTLAFVGDVVLGEYVQQTHRSFAGPQAPSAPFEAVAPVLRADVLVGNLESPVMTTIPTDSPLRFGHRFGASEPAVRALAQAGFSVMSLANNHANDLGRAGLEHSPQLLRAHGIVPVGQARSQGSPFVVETLRHEGWSIGLVAATTWLNHEPLPDEPSVPVVSLRELADVLVPVVDAARPDHDLMIVLLHWGRELRERPDDAQRAAAHALVDAGADLVIGHHPHVLQGIERYRGALIAYSLGNFLFPARRPQGRDSAVLRVQVAAGSGCVQQAEIHAVRVGGAPGHAPVMAKGDRRRSILGRMRRLGRSLLTPLQHQDGALVWTSPVCPPTAEPRAVRGPDRSSAVVEPDRMLPECRGIVPW